ncbi:MAG TPA: ATP-binding protein [Ohtaekwangia sp.]|nr:ATP-binding protein [Ohtaekwangia sp.]
MNATEIKQAKKVAIIGPECTGKSDLSAFLADHFKTSWVPEYARGYIDNLVRPYTEDDLLIIAHGQLRLEESFSQTVEDVLICDTNLYVIKIWSEFKFGRCAQEILDEIETRPYDLYLLTYIDIPWEEDPQREHPEEREKLYSIYLQEMQQQNVPFIEIKGEKQQRRKTAIDAIEKLLIPA